MTDPQDQPQHDGHSLAVPFTACASNGGPYDDQAFVGGFDCGAMHTEMRLLRTLGATPAARWVKPAILDQLDLLAMDSGYTIKRGRVDEASRWTWVQFIAPTCAHDHLGLDGEED